VANSHSTSQEIPHILRNSNVHYRVKNSPQTLTQCLWKLAVEETVLT